MWPITIKEQKIEIECWPRHVDPTLSNAKQYPGWPLSFDLDENYGREAVARLPTLNISGLEDPPVVQVIDETQNEIVYTKRMDSMIFSLKVFSTGPFTVKVGEPGTDKIQLLNGLLPLGKETKEIIDIFFKD